MTVLYFLNDVEEGGETAFPLADNATCDTKVRNELFYPNYCCYIIVDRVYGLETRQTSKRL